MNAGVTLVSAILAVAVQAVSAADRFYGVDYGVEKNARGIRAVRLAKVDGKDQLTLQDPAGNWPQMSSKTERLDDGTLRVTVPWRKTEVEAVFFEKDGKRCFKGTVKGAEPCAFAGAEVDPNPQPKDVPPLFDGTPWPQRRAALLKLFAKAEFGVRPVEHPKDLVFKTAPDVTILDGKAVHRAVEISCKGPYGPFAFTAHAYLPKGARKVGAFVAIALGGRIRKEGFAPTAEDPSFHSCPVRDIIGRGFAVVVFDNWDVALDDKAKCFQSGVFAAFGPKERAATSWGALSAWAWGASRVVDWIETQPEIDMRRLGVVGHSRGGKTSLWAGATDERFTLVCDNASGAGGSKLNHVDLPASEPYVVLAWNLSHFFCPAFCATASQDEGKFPYDQHMLLALVAPRRLCVGSCAEDSWAGPVGQRTACELASPAWERLGVGGYGDRVRWHIVPGPHDLSIANWRHYMDAMDAMER